MGTRDYQFTTGPETPLLPTATAPTGADDFVTLGYVQANFIPSGGGGGENQGTIDDAASLTDLSGLLFDKDLYRQVKVEYTIERRNDTFGKRVGGMLMAFYEQVSDTWIVSNRDYGANPDGEASGVDFSITTLGQVQYVSDALGGPNYVGKIRYQIIKRFAKET
ncbi:MAG: hypothetical protein SGI74_12890 [Oligoflexia bacterium]|nr:hypothetical protein [Oligoflexia bacterium]